MTHDGVDVDRIATTDERLGLVTPDCQGPDAGDESDEIVVVISVHGGLIQDVGTRGRDIPRLRVIVTDHDTYEATDGESGVYTEGVTEIERWSRDENSALVRAATELPDDLRRELGLAEPE
jgi:hypothetical protein